MNAPTFNTITSTDWREMFARHRAQGRIEGNAILMQIRAAMAKKFPGSTATKSLQPIPAHADNQPEWKIIAPGNSFAVVGSAARERSAVSRAEAGDGDSLSASGPCVASAASTQTGENEADALRRADVKQSTF